MPASDDPHPLSAQVGRRVAELRRAAGWTQEQLAAELDCTIQWLSRVETKGENLQLATIATLAEVLDVEPYELLVEAGEDAREVRRGRPPKGT